MGDDVICVQTSERGKWHVEQRLLTACGIELRGTGGLPRKYLSLIDSKDRCRTEGCVTARNRAAGRVA